MNPNPGNKTEAKVTSGTGAPSPLWAITIGMGVFFVVAAALFAAG